MKNKIVPEKTKIKATKATKATHKHIDNETISASKPHIQNESKPVEAIDTHNDDVIPVYSTPVSYPIVKLRLNSIPNVKRSINRCIRGVANGQIPQERARTMGFLLQICLSAWKIESELIESKQIRKQLEEIKEALHE